MSMLKIRGATALDGTIKVHGAKNSVLPILAASLLAKGETVIHNCPRLSDVNAAVKILRHLGCKIAQDKDSVYIDSREIVRCDIPDSLMREMRSSVIFLGAILARTGEAILSLPGGCELGPRPIDMHLAALKQLGSEISGKDGNIICTAAKITGSRINLPMPSVGATENSILAAAAGEGTTVITNAAKEPEIVDLQKFLVGLGAKVTGAGTSTIFVEGTNFGKSTEFSVMPDRIAAATFLSAAASTNGKVEVTGVVPHHISTVTDVLEDMGCKIDINKDSVRIDARRKLKAAKPITTQPYPGFPTDAQPPVMAAALKAEGTTVFIENIFESRYRHVSELLRMGAHIKTEGRVAVVSGVKCIHGAPVASTDLRGGASLVVAALGAEGTTEISQIQHIDRGYDNIEGCFRQLGAEIERINS